MVRKAQQALKVRKVRKVYKVLREQQALRELLV
jgi:hypothetical protein